MPQILKAIVPVRLSDVNRLAFVDGLRAIALLLVLFFHFEISGFENGFLGVDIFFVISGFVVTRAILERESNFRFNFIEFYLSRYLRVAPALYFTVALTLLSARIIFLPSAVLGVAGASIAGVSFLSNIHSLFNYDYFSQDLVIGR